MHRSDAFVASFEWTAASVADAIQQLKPEEELASASCHTSGMRSESQVTCAPMAKAILRAGVELK